MRLFRPLLAALTFSMALPALGHAFAHSSQGGMPAPVKQTALSAPLAGIAHGGHGAPASLPRPRVVALRWYQWQAAQGHEHQNFTLPRGGSRHDSGLPSAAWTRFFIPLQLVLASRPGVRRFRSGWAPHWPIRPPPVFIP